MELISVIIGAVSALLPALLKIFKDNRKIKTYIKAGKEVMEVVKAGREAIKPDRDGKVRIETHEIEGVFKEVMDVVKIFDADKKAA